MIIGLSLSAPVSSQQFGEGDWAASKIGQVCYVFTVRSARHTSGNLIFHFENQGFNAGFRYEYEPWPGETDAPWGSDDYVVLEVDNEEIWLGDEMFPEEGRTGYLATMTQGFVSEMITELEGATNSVAYAMYSEEQAENQTFGLFSVAGFSESLAKAGEWCQFNPSDLPSS